MEIIEVSSCSVAPGDRDSPQHSQWLQKTLSDMNERMKAMMTLLEEDGNSSDRVASHSKRRLELVQMLEEFNRSYRYLAETYERLRSKFLVKDSRPTPSYSAIDSNKETPIESSDNSNLEILDSNPQFVVEDPEIKCDSANFDVEYLMEENLQQQNELARRNIEKKLVIDKLRLQLEHVKAENRSLQNCISCLKVGEKRKSLQLRGLLSGKFFGGGCT